MNISDIMIEEMKVAITSAYKWGNDSFIAYGKTAELKSELERIFGEERANELDNDTYNPDDLELTDEERAIFNKETWYDIKDFTQEAEELCYEYYVNNDGDVCSLDSLEGNLNDEVYNMDFIYKSGYKSWWDFPYKDMYKDYYEDAFKKAIDEMSDYVEDVLVMYDENDDCYNVLRDLMNKYRLNYFDVDYNTIAEKLISEGYVVNEYDELVMNDDVIDERFLRVYGMREWFNR